MEQCLRHLKHAFDNKPADEIFIQHPQTNKIAVIIEPRFDSITEQVIYNFMHFLNPLGWNLVYIGFSGFHQTIQEKLPYAYVFDIGDQHIFFDQDGVPNISIQSYNTILLDPALWRTMQIEHILIFQRDCIMLRPFDSYFLLYDYAGANYLLNLAPMYGGINGGFSLRRRSAMLECLEKVTWESIDEYRKIRNYPDLTIRNEDVFFTHACEILCKTVPDIYHRGFLCIENDFNPRTSVHHGWNKGYQCEENIMILLRSSPLFSSVDGSP